MEINIPAWIAPGLTAMAVSLLIVITKRWHGKHSLDTMVGVQKFHASPTPRIGGVAIFTALVAAWLLSPEPLSRLLGPMLIAGFPAFAVGLAEDLTKRVGVRERLLATMLSGLTAWWLTGYSINQIGIGSLDPVFAWLPFSVAFTAFAVAGVANSVNIIDGFNGLAGGTLMICFSALGLIAWLAGDMQMTSLSVIFAMIVAGFLVVNFPFGKLFLGDGGAYLLGFLLAWVAVMLPMRNPSVSVWAPLLVCGYPVMETIFSMARRLLTRSGPGNADSGHLHSMIKRKIVRRYFSALPQTFRNSLVSPFCWAFALIPAALAVNFYADTRMLVASWFCCFAVYINIFQFLAWNMEEHSIITPSPLSGPSGDDSGMPAVGAGGEVALPRIIRDHEHAVSWRKMHAGIADLVAAVSPGDVRPVVQAAGATAILSGADIQAAATRTVASREEAQPLPSARTLSSGLTGNGSNRAGASFTIPVDTLQSSLHPAVVSEYYFRQLNNPSDQKRAPESTAGTGEPSCLVPALNILIAEDDKASSLILKSILKGVNITIFHAGNGCEAVELVRRHPEINIVLMDIKMPLMDGFEATMLIKHLRPELPVIAQSAFNTDDYRARAREAGCNAFIPKPINHRELLEQVQAQLSKE